MREATTGQNSINSYRRKDNTSGLKGIDHVSNNKFRVRTHINGKEIHIGNFDNLNDAIEARDKAVKELHGEFARVGWNETKAMG